MIRVTWECHWCGKKATVQHESVGVPSRPLGALPKAWSGAGGELQHHARAFCREQCLRADTEACLVAAEAGAEERRGVYARLREEAQ